jgi:tRNA pseudouridine55 synthase
VGGRRLHELAREGLEVEREARAIGISEFSLTPGDGRDCWDFEVECSVGTYVRVLLSDFAHRLDTVGHLTALRRLSSGAHHVDQAVTLEQLGELARAAVAPLAPAAAFVTGLERTVLGADQERRIRMGQRIAIDGSFVGSEIAALDARGVLVAILCPRGENWKPELVLPVEPAEPQG